MVQSFLLPSHLFYPHSAMNLVCNHRTVFHFSDIDFSRTRHTSNSSSSALRHPSLDISGSVKFLLKFMKWERFVGGDIKHAVVLL